MRRHVMAVLVGAVITLAAVATWAQAPAACLADGLRAAVAQACPCGSARNHGQFMKCVRKQMNEMRKSGCDVKTTTQVTRCAAQSICGKPKTPVVCCNRHGHPKLTSADKCTAKGGTVMPGVTSLCDAVCPTPAL